MGYEVVAFRGTDRWEPQAIAPEAWDEFVRAEGLRSVDRVSITAPSGEVITMVGQFLLWSGHSFGKPVTLTIRSGRAQSVTNPDDETIRWLARAAQRFGARVQGDEGEFYDETWPGRSESPPYNRPLQPGRRSWFGRRSH